jgi:hypothetical protein
MPKILTALRIDEVSAVDRGAGEGVKIVLMKRDDTAGRSLFNDFMAKADDGDDDAGDRGDENTSLANHPIVQIARLLVANGHKADIASALDYLLNTSHGAALLHRVRTHKGDTMSTNETVESILKDCGPVSFCKAIVDRGRAPCTENELVTVLSKDAAERFSMPGDRAFSKLYEAEIVVRQACAIAKAMPLVADLEPLMVGGTAAQDLNDPSAAIAQLREIGRDRWPTASEAQQFARAMTDPTLVKLAAKAHVRPSAPAGGAYPFPR